MSRRWRSLCLLICIAALAGCVAAGTGDRPGDTLGHEARAEGTDEASASEQEAIRYYIAKLPDRDYIDSYGGDEHPRPWYKAAEALGEIGKPAVPALIQRLGSGDPYELKLALYALMLASQDPALLAETGGDYLRLRSVLTRDTNAENRRVALDWWQRYRHLWA